MHRRHSMFEASKDDERSWRARLADLALRCAAADRAQGAQLVRQAYGTLGVGPGIWRMWAASLPPVDRIEAMLAAGSETSAALALIEGRAGFMLSHSPDGCYMATVISAERCEEATAEGDSAALALIGALAANLAAGAECSESRSHADGAVGLSPRLS